MADFDQDQLLLGYNIDLKPMKDAAKIAEQIISDLDAKWAGSAKKYGAAAASAAEGQQKVKSAVADVVQQTEAAVKAARKQSEAGKEVADGLRNEILQHQAKKAAIAAETAEIAKQTAEIRKRRLERMAEEGGGGERKEREEHPSARRSLLGGVVRGALGEGIAGEVASGVVAGEGITAAIEGAGNAVEHFIEHLRELSLESGSITELQSVFNKLTETLGVQGETAMAQLEKSSEGLVDKLTLLKVSIAAMASPLRISLPQLNELVHSVSLLSEASGHGAQEGIQATLRALTTGRFQQLSYVTGVTSLRELTAQIPPVLQGTARMRKEFELIQKVLHQRAEFFDELPDTMEKASQQMSVFSRNLDLAFGQGFNESDGLRSIREAVESIGGKMGDLTEKAKRFGNMVGDVVGLVVRGLTMVVNVLDKITFTSFAVGAPLIALASVALLKGGLAARQHAKEQAEDVVATRELTAAIREQTEAMAENAVASEADTVVKGGGRSVGKRAGRGAAEEGVELAEGAAGGSAAASATKAVATESAAAEESATALGAAASEATSTMATLAPIALTAAAALGVVAVAATNAKNSAQAMARPDVIVTWGDTWRAFKDNASDNLSGVRRLFHDIAQDWKAQWDSAKEGVKNTIDGIKGFWAKWGEDIKTITLGTLNEIMPGFSNLLDTWKTGWVAAINEVKSHLPGLQKALIPNTPSLQERALIEATQRTAMQAAQAAADKATKAQQYATIGRSDKEKAQRQKLADEAKQQADAAMASARQTVNTVDAANKLLSDVQAKSGKASAAAKPAMDALDKHKQAEAMEQLRALYGEPEQLLPHQDAELARAKARAEEAEAKRTLAAQKGLIEQERALDAQSYQQGEESFAQHQERLRSIAQESYAAQLAEAKQQRDSKVAELNRQVADGTMLPAVASFEKQAANTELDTAMETAARQRETELSKITEDGVHQRLATEIKATEDRLNLTKAAIAEEAKLNKQRFENGMIDPRAYAEAQYAQAVERAQAEVAAARSNYLAGPQTPERLEEYQGKVKASVQAAQAEITSTVEEQTANQIKYIENVYGTQQKAIDAQLAYNKQFGNAYGTSHSNATLLQEQRDSLEEQIKAYEQAFSEANNDPTERYSKEWWQIVENTQAAYTKLQLCNEELVKMLALSGPIGNAMQDIGKNMQQIFPEGPEYFTRTVAGTGNHGALTSTVQRNRLMEFRDLGTAFSTGGQALHAGDDLSKRIRNLGKAQLPPQIQEMVDMASKVRTGVEGATQPLIAELPQVTSKFTALGSALDTAQVRLLALGAGTAPTSGSAAMANYRGASALSAPSVGLLGMNNPNPLLSIPTHFASESGGPANTASPKNPAEIMGKFTDKLSIAVDGLSGFISSLTSAKDATSGMVQGGSSGMGLGNAANSAMSDMGGLMGSMSSFMPGVGAALGVVMGGIMGEKNAMVQQELDQLKATYQEMTEQYSSGNATLAQTIQKMQMLIVQAEADMASSKKGGQQFQDLINQYNQQLQQYLDQQQALIREMNTTVGKLQLPNYGNDFGNYIDSLSQIITQFEQYAGAAQSASDAMKAQTYLQQSIAGLQQQWTQQLQQDQTQAVQDALQLNTLQMQYNQLLQQTAQQERSVMSQGVLTRQTTFAQSKAQQLAQIQYQANLQLDQMHQEMSLAQAKVDAEKQIFNIATTRIGLEAQLLQLQEAQAGRQMQQVAALADVLQALNTGVASNNSPLATQNNFILSLLSALMGTNANANSIAGLLSTYNAYASSGLGPNGTGV